jgi:adenylate cyclase
MADLIALGPDGEQRWRQTFPPRPVTLGRRPEHSEWAADWDGEISRLHATLHWQGDRLLVRREPTGRNPVYFHGEPLDEFAAAVGDSFVIGQTRFLVQDSAPAAAADPTPHTELTCSRRELREVRYLDADARIEALAALPEVIRYSPGDEELENRVVDVLLQGIVGADAAAIVCLKPAAGGAEPEIEVRAVKSRDPGGAPWQPSRRLVLDAIGSRRQSVLYRWNAPPARPDDFTAYAAVDWAVCAPLPDDPTPGWGLYIIGRVPEAPAGVSPAQQEAFKGDLKFAELAADVFGALRHVRDLQRRHALLSRFLSQAVLGVLLTRENLEEVLKPREAEVSVLFCDLRGSCRISEEGQEGLTGLWDSVSAALGIMTSGIADQDGVIGDFQGDAAMGFWGWPLAVPDQVQRAARAALYIRRRFARVAQDRGRPLAGFACGIGIAHGRAVAGKLGTDDQFKVGVFGPVVNLASRLESLTKLFQVPVLVDERAAQALAGSDSLWWRCRRVARVQPYGMKTVLTVSELLPPVQEPGAMPEQDRKDYEAALDAFLAGRWADASALLRPLRQDGPACFLRDFMQRRQNAPPPGWDGTIVLEAK